MLQIVIADDENIERRVLKRKLERFLGDAAQVSCAENGREVLNLYEELHPDIFILDIEMPGVTGLEAAQEIRKLDKNSSIIFLTAFDDFAYAKKAISVHALDYLLKPCDDKELIAAVEEAQRIAEARIASGSDMSRIEVKEPLTEEAPQNRQEQFRKYLNEHYSEDISVQSMASEFGYADAYFCKIFKQYFGQSFVAWLTEFRVERAMELLVESDESVGHVGKLVGYPDANYFTKVFRRVAGVSPSEYRANPR